MKHDDKIEERRFEEFITKELTAVEKRLRLLEFHKKRNYCFENNLKNRNLKMFF